MTLDMAITIIGLFFLGVSILGVIIMLTVVIKNRRILFKS